jgi:hypothetical protein
MTSTPAKIEQLKARIARKKRHDASRAADERELTKLVTKQLRRENRLDRKARRVA